MYVARLSVCRWYGFEERLDRVAAKDILLAAHSWGRWRFALLTLISTVGVLRSLSAPKAMSPRSIDLVLDRPPREDAVLSIVPFPC